MIFYFFKKQTYQEPFRTRFLHNFKKESSLEARRIWIYWTFKNENLLEACGTRVPVIAKKKSPREAFKTKLNFVDAIFLFEDPRKPSFEGCSEVFPL